MSGTIGYEELRAGTVRQVAQLMAAAAITAPKSGGQLFLAGKPSFMETVIADDPVTRKDLAAWMRARGTERRERIWFRDADAEKPRRHPVHRAPARLVPAQLRLRRLRVRRLRRIPPPHQNPAQPVRRTRIHRPRVLRDIDLGIAVGSAAKTAAIHSIDCRCQTRAAVAARKLDLIQADHAVALSLSMTHKAVGFDRPMPEADFDTAGLPPTGTLPVGIPDATRQGGARNRQAPRQPIPRTQPSARPPQFAAAASFDERRCLASGGRAGRRGIRPGLPARSR